MSVPETAVDEDHGLVFPQNDVGFAGDVLHVQAVTETVLPEPFADEDFRLGVFAADVRHVQVTLGWGEMVGHLVLFVWSVWNRMFSHHAEFFRRLIIVNSNAVLGRKI